MARRAASLDGAIDWIARNDETAESDPEVLATLVSVTMVADLWSREPMQIAKKVLTRRRDMLMCANCGHSKYVHPVSPALQCPGYISCA